MALPDPRAPFCGLEADTLRFMEAHQARSVTIPGRIWRDLGDAVLLFSGVEKEPFFNRLVAVRWPSDAAMFDDRLREACELFTALERRPYVWAVPGLSRPDDLIARLAANGFVDQGGGYDLSPFVVAELRCEHQQQRDHHHRQERDLRATAAQLASSGDAQLLKALGRP